MGLAAAVSVAILHDGSSPPAMLASQSYSLWGEGTPREWVSWADRIVVVQLVAEEEVPYDPGEFGGGEGLVARRMTARLEQEIWAHAGARPLPAAVELRATDGWWYDDGLLVPMKEVGGHRAAVGDRLLVGIFDSEKHGWTMMTGGVPLDGHGRARPEPDQADLGARVAGMTLPQLERIFRAARPLPNVERFRHLDIEERMIAVHEHATRNAQGPTG